VQECVLGHPMPEMRIGKTTGACVEPVPDTLANSGRENEG